MNLRYSEAFYSIQGEGRFVGVPSLFLRTFGCNFRCRSFGRDREEEMGKHNPEVKELLDSGVVEKTKTFKDLPIVHTGCDTYASIYPEFKKFMQNKTVDETVEHLLSLIPEGRWTQSNGQDIHLILTGGEPMLWQKFWPELFAHPDMQDLKNVTIETNTTQKLQPDFEHWLRTQDRIYVTFSCSPKLTVSGERWDDAIRGEIARQYHAIPNSNQYFKFVVADERDVDEVTRATEQFKEAGVQCPVYIMPLGGRSEEYELNTDRVAKLAMARGWRYTPRLHIELFGNAWGT
jgi:organic radical activating enzyme